MMSSSSSSSPQPRFVVSSNAFGLVPPPPPPLGPFSRLNPAPASPSKRPRSTSTPSSITADPRLLKTSRTQFGAGPAPVRQAESSAGGSNRAASLPTADAGTAPVQDGSRPEALGGAQTWTGGTNSTATAGLSHAKMLVAELDAFVDECEAAKAESAQLKQQLNAKHDEIVKLNNERVRLNSTLEHSQLSQQTNAAQLGREKDELANRVATLESNATKAADTIIALKSQVDDDSDELFKLKRRLDAADSEVIEERKRADEAVAERIEAQSALAKAVEFLTNAIDGRTNSLA